MKFTRKPLKIHVKKKKFSKFTTFCLLSMTDSSDESCFGGLSLGGIFQPNFAIFHSKLRLVSLGK